MRINTIYKNLKPTFNMSKEVIKKIISKIDLVEVKTEEICNCENCIFSKFSSHDLVSKYCNLYCNKRIIKKEVSRIDIGFSKHIYNEIKEKVKPEFEKNIIHLAQRNTYRLSNTQIKQIFLYYSLVDSKGILFDYPKKILAEKLNCSLRTIDNNNTILEKLGFILINKKSYGKVSLIIPNYYKQHQPGGGGYMVISNQILDAIIESEMVDFTRLIVNCILVQDMNNITRKETIVSYSKLKELIPSNAYPKGLEDVLKEGYRVLNKFIKGTNFNEDEDIINSYGYCEIKDSSYMFNFNIDDEKNILFKMNLDYDGKTILNKIKTESKISLTKFMEDNEMPEKVINSIDDLVALACEYGIEPVMEALNFIKDEGFATISNIGAYIRGFITNQLIVYPDFFKLAI